nr:MAG TPA: hypothetical protein [Caudoviricetes sp.]
MRNRSNAGLFYVNSNNETGNTRWNICSRHSGNTLFRYLSQSRLPSPLWRETGIGLAQRVKLSKRPPGW